MIPRCSAKFKSSEATELANRSHVCMKTTVLMRSHVSVSSFAHYKTTNSHFDISPLAISKVERESVFDIVQALCLVAPNVIGVYLRW
jgi:hypothetical protein